MIGGRPRTLPNRGWESWQFASHPKPRYDADLRPVLLCGHVLYVAETDMNSALASGYSQTGCRSEPKIKCPAVGGIAWLD
jgi:hypothetical protein